MKKITAIIAVFAAISASASQRGAAAKTDTTVKLFQVQDTVKASLIYCNQRGYVRYCENGKIVVKGFKNTASEWDGQPSVVFAMDERGHKVYKLIQVIQVK